MTNRPTITLALVQMRCTGSPQENLARALEGIAESARRRAQLVVLPELFLGPYFCQRPDDRSAFDLAESIPGPTTEALSQAARRHRVVLVGGSIFEKTSDGRFFNTAVVFNAEGSLLGTYRKTHIPEDILYHEQHYFAPGDTGVRIFDTPAGKIAPLICYDQWYPEAARLATLAGAEIIVYPTAIGLIDDSVEANITGDWEQMWRSAQVGHAAVNNVYVAAVNRVGREGAIQFWGGSFVADPSGALLARAGAGEEVAVVSCDLARVSALQQAWRFLANRRPAVYGGLVQGGEGAASALFPLVQVPEASVDRGGVSASNE
jgi:N-carbamoylputrescine amidase